MVEIFVFNRTEVTKVAPSVPHIFISIADRYSKHPNLVENENCLGVLKIQFEDFDIDLDYDAIPNDKMEQFGLFTKDNAKTIMDFVKSHNPEQIIVHCNMGLSRSPAVMAALYDYFGQEEDAKKVFDKFALNGHVYRTIKNYGSVC